MIDLQKIILLSIKYWWVYFISVFVCLVVAGVCYVTTPASFNVDASLMLRQVDYRRQDNHQAELLNMMGGGTQKEALDEIQVLSSRSIFEPIIEEMGLTVTCQRYSNYKWLNVYPEHPFDVQVEPNPNSKPNQLEIIVIKVKVKDGVCMIKDSESLAKKKVAVHMNEGTEDGEYKIFVRPLLKTVALFQELYTVSRDNRESHILKISTKSTCPKLAIDFINNMLDSYNSQTANDKNILALQTDQFLSNRLEVISAELAQAENDLQEYKSTHHIADLDKSADDYRKSIVQYDMEMADLEARISILDYTEKEISKEENKRKIFPYVDEKLALVTVDGVPSALADQVKQYNAGITRLNTMLMSEEEDHPLVQEELKQIEEIRQNILSNIVQNRQSAELQRASLIKQKKDFQDRLSDIPEQDRTYRELKRLKNTKENQYVYLVQRREENAMLLASAAIPAITIDRAQMNPIKVAPKVSVYGFMAILLGLALPLCFFIGKEVLILLLKLKDSIKE